MKSEVEQFVTPQFNILTKTIWYTSDKTMVYNPFYNRTKEYVLENFIEAKRIYSFIFRNFIGSAYIIKGKDWLRNIPTEWEELNV